jgi:hypothetical protein
MEYIIGQVLKQNYPLRLHFLFGYIKSICGTTAIFL